ncbi:hypothetical protein [Streptomyces sp. NPDC059894]
MRCRDGLRGRSGPTWLAVIAVVHGLGPSLLFAADTGGGEQHLQEDLGVL